MRSSEYRSQWRSRIRNLFLPFSCLVYLFAFNLSVLPVLCSVSADTATTIVPRWPKVNGMSKLKWTIWMQKCCWTYRHWMQPSTWSTSGCDNMGEAFSAATNQNRYSNQTNNAFLSTYLGRVWLWGNSLSQNNCRYRQVRSALARCVCSTRCKPRDQRADLFLLFAKLNYKRGEIERERGREKRWREKQMFGKDRKDFEKVNKILKGCYCEM